MLNPLSMVASLTQVDLDTSPVRTHALVVGPPEAPPLLLIHGNVSSSTFFQDLMLRLGSQFRVVAPDLRGFGSSASAPVDGSLGVQEFAQDLQTVLDSGLLGIGRPVHLLGWSMGAGVAIQYLISHPERVASLILESPMSPYGFGGTRDAQGTPCWPDFAGSGGGAANPELVRRLAAGDRGDDSELAPRRILRSMYLNPQNQLPAEWEEALLSSMLATVIGEDNYPGESVPSGNWPFVAPGHRGVLNALSPKYCNLSALGNLSPGPDILWIRGSEDQIVSDTSLSDIGYLGQLGAVPGWPGVEIFPPQPMVAQTRAVLERYRESGAVVEERVLAGCGHSPHLERPKEFAEMLREFLLERV